MHLNRDCYYFNNKRKLMKIRLSKLHVVFVALVVAGITFYYATQVMIPPFQTIGSQSLGQVSLGMKEVDVLLEFGRKPDCIYPKDSDFKEMGYHIERGSNASQVAPTLGCRYRVTLTQDGDSLKVSTVCYSLEISRSAPIYTTSMKYEWPRSIGGEYYMVPYTEQQVLKDFGSPSYTSISEEGTSKFISFDRHNVGFFIMSGNVAQACVSNRLPLRLVNEYKG